MTIVRFSKDELRQALETVGFSVDDVRVSGGQFIFASRLNWPVYDDEYSEDGLLSSDPLVEIVVYTTIDPMTDLARDTAKDSIRVVCVYHFPDGKDYAYKLQGCWVTRTWVGDSRDEAIENVANRVMEKVEATRKLIGLNSLVWRRRDPPAKGLNERGLRIAVRRCQHCGGLLLPVYSKGKKKWYVACLGECRIVKGFPQWRSSAKMPRCLKD